VILSRVERLCKAPVVSGALAALILACGWITACSKGGTVKVPLTYQFATWSLPERLSPWSNQVNAYHLIHLQLYSPLFEKRDPVHGSKTSLFSRYLDLEKTRALELDFKSFQFCLREGVRFSDRTIISRSDMRASIEQLHKAQEGMPKLLEVIEPTEGQAGCLRVFLSESSETYFDYFTGVTSAILKQSSLGSLAPVGKGPFNVTEFGTERIRAKRDDEYPSEKGKFDWVEFKLYRGYDAIPSREATGASLVIDSNHFSPEAQPASLVEGTKTIELPILKSYAWVNTYPDHAFRLKWLQCLARVERLPGLPFKLTPTPGFLPTGVDGNDVSLSEVLTKIKGSAKTSCSPIAGKSPKIRYVNYDPELREALVEFFRLYRDSLPAYVDVVDLPIEDAMKASFAGEAMITRVGFDTSGSTAAANRQAATFFEAFYREERLVRVPLRRVEKAVRLALSAKDPESRRNYYRDAHRELLGSGHVFPLGQLYGVFHYHKGLKNIHWEDDFSNFPLVHALKFEPGVGAR
jgi:hypothetical protein